MATESKSGSELKNRTARVVTDGETIIGTIDVEMSPERVYRAFNTEELEHWWGSPDSYRMTQWHSDLRVGGKWSVIVAPSGGGAMHAGGEFLEIDAPNKIVFTRIYDFDFPILGRRATTVTYRADPIPGGTRVTVRHDGFAGMREPADHHVFGWERVLGWLEAYARRDNG